MSNLGKKVLLYRTNVSGNAPSSENITIGELALNYNADTPFIAFKDSNNSIQKVGTLQDIYTKSEVNTLIDNVTNGDIELANYYTKAEVYNKNEVDDLIPTVPTKTSELTNDSGFITIGDVPQTDLTNYYTKTETYSQSEVNELVNNIEHKLSSTYESVTYVKDDLFTPASANQTLDEAIKTVDSNISTLVKEVLNNEITVAAALTKHNESAGFDENGNYVVNTAATYISAATNLSEADALLDSGLVNLQEQINSLPTLDGYATETYVSTQITTVVNGLVDNAPDALNTLNELSAALNDDANFATTVTNQIATKANSSDVYTKTESDAKYSLTSHTHTFNDIEEKPTTLNGYGITDATINESTKTIVLGENSLTITDPVLSSDYISVEYLEETGNKTFTPASANQTMNEAIFTVETNVATLVQAVIENENVVAAALTKHNESAGFDENANYVANTAATYISAATNLSEADVLLDSAITELSNQSDAKYSLTSHTHDIYALQTELNTANNTINELQTKITSLEALLDRVIVAVGLNTTTGDTYGTFVVPTTAETSGYTTAATSVMSAIHLMDNQIEENETVAAYALTDLNDRITNLENA